MPKTNPRIKLTVSLTVISVILGLMLSLQYKNTRATAQLAASVPPVDPKAQYTQEQLNKVKEQNKVLESDIEKLNKQLHEIEKHAGDVDKSIAPEIKDDLTKYKMMAGLLPIKGAGVTFTISDSDKEAASGGYSATLITHDVDLRLVVNELLLAGAEAVAINDQRITTTSGIICIGPVVKINGQRVNPPFEFKAIGNPNAITSSLQMQGGVLDWLADPNGRALNVTKPKASTSVMISGYAGDFNGLGK
ncbi:MAG: DUF881 domain-containing protein [Tumebacillaceae bacterium]